MFFLPMWPGMAQNQRVTASAIAGQEISRDSRRDFAELIVDPPAAGFEMDRSYPVKTVGDSECEQALERRFFQDTDMAATEYHSYRASGNGRRVMVARVNASTGTYVTMLVQRDSGKSCSATYAGDAPVIGAAMNGAGSPGLYEVRLFRR